MTELKEYLNKIVQYTESEMELFSSLFSEKQFLKNDYFAVEGEYSTKLAFMSSGVVRAFYRNKQGNEYNKTFFSKNGFVAPYSSLVTNQKNVLNNPALKVQGFDTQD